MIKYTRINTIELANLCDKLLTELIKEESIYDVNARNDYTVKSFYRKTIDKETTFLYLATDNKIPVGYIYCYETYKKGSFVKNSVALIDALYVIPEYRNQGIATDLINSCKSWCDEKDIKVLEISSYKNNENALKLYNKLGFLTHTYRMSTKL